MRNKILFWRTDLQNDFMEPTGSLAIQGAETIRPQVKMITDFANEIGSQVVLTGDYHTLQDDEISTTPDFVKTFPAHCLRKCPGSDFIKEVAPDKPVFIDHIPFQFGKKAMAAVKESKEVVIFKNKFDVYSGNACTEQVVNLISPELIVVDGVATNVCVNAAVVGHRQRGYNVCVILDAIKEIPNLPLIEVINNWINLGVSFAVIDSVGKMSPYLLAMVRSHKVNILNLKSEVRSTVWGKR